MKKDNFKKVKCLLVVLYFVSIVPVIVCFGKDIRETVSDKAKTSDEIYEYYGSWGFLTHHDEWKILQVLKGKDQIINTEFLDSGYVAINEGNREQILNDFLNVRICKLVLAGIAVLLVMGLSFIGMFYRKFYISAWGIVLGIETYLAQLGADCFLFRMPFFERCAGIGIVVGVLLFILLNVADWIQIKSDFKFRFVFLKMIGCLVAGYGITLFFYFYPLRYTESAFALLFLIPALFISLFFVFMLRMAQLRLRCRLA